MEFLCTVVAFWCVRPLAVGGSCSHLRESSPIVDQHENTSIQINATRTGPVYIIARGVQTHLCLSHIHGVLGLPSTVAVVQARLQSSIELLDHGADIHAVDQWVDVASQG